MTFPLGNFGSTAFYLSVHPEVEALALPQLSHKFKLSWTLQLFSQATAFPASAALVELRESDFFTELQTLPTLVRSSAERSCHWLCHSAARPGQSGLSSIPTLFLLCSQQGCYSWTLCYPQTRFCFCPIVPLPSLVLCLST